MTPSSGHPTIWLIDGPILVLYLAAAALAFLVSEINDRTDSVSSKDKPMPAAAIVILTLTSHCLAVASLVLLANALSSSTRLSMLAMPLLLLVERYARIGSREPEKHIPAAYALAGSVAGVLIGAFAFMRKVATPDPLAHVTLSGDVPTVPVAELLHDRGNWAVSIKLVVFYVISIAIFVGLHAALGKTAKRMMTCAPENLKQRAALAALLAFALNFLGVVALVLIAKSSDVQLRLAMVGFPLFLIAESYVGVLRAEPQNRPSTWTGLVGSSTGMVLASFFLLRGAPLH